MKLYKDTYERALATFVEAALAAIAVTYDVNNPVEPSYVLKVAVCAGAVALIKGVVAGRIGEKDSASLVRLK